MAAVSDSFQHVLSCKNLYCFTLIAILAAIWEDK
jgi:hypothetical protein